MEILSSLLRRLAMPGGRGTTVPDRRDCRPVTVLEPVQLSPSQRDQIEDRIAEFIEESPSVYAQAHEVIARAKLLPLYFDWTGLMALRLDGQIVTVPYEDEPARSRWCRSAVEKSRPFPGSQAPSRPSIPVAQEAARCA